jgi:putative Mg2+ transporter-C (MgtC) family protein
LGLRRFTEASRVTEDVVDIAVRLGAALLAGGLIGFERSFHGRPAGFRTHALVCLGAAMLMLVPVYQATWLGIPVDQNFSANPSRVIQGIMTGIGFLGAGVIFKQGFFNVAGLTTAASLWFTARLGSSSDSDSTIRRCSPLSQRFSLLQRCGGSNGA